jgi:thiol-disulfide isomerase/thioredoxin
LVVLECTLGAGLLFFYCPRLILPATALLLLIFIGATGWAWLTGSTTDCGCFGSWLKRTTGQAAFEGLIMLAVTILAWIGIPHSQVLNTRTKAWAVAIACLIGLALPTVSGFSVSRISLSQAKTAEIDLRHLEIENLDPIDLKHGMHLVVLMDTDCLHCQKGVEQLNALAQQPNVPPITALFMNKESERRKFAEEFRPIFSIKQVNEDVFWRLLGDGDIPRTILFRDGLVLQVWDEKIPEKESLSILSVQ